MTHVLLGQVRGHVPAVQQPVGPKLMEYGINRQAPCMRLDFGRPTSGSEPDNDASKMPVPIKGKVRRGNNFAGLCDSKQQKHVQWTDLSHKLDVNSEVPYPHFALNATSCHVPIGVSHCTPPDVQQIQNNKMQPRQYALGGRVDNKEEAHPQEYNTSDARFQYLHSI
jgi:hypothetical protein